MKAMKDCQCKIDLGSSRKQQGKNRKQPSPMTQYRHYKRRGAVDRKRKPGNTKRREKGLCRRKEQELCKPKEKGR